MNKTAELHKVETASAVRPAKKPKAAAEKPKKFTKERLREECQALFGVPECGFDGAMHGREGEMTVGEAKNTIKKWLETKMSKPKKED